mmetsp:Transcript_63805/g.207339  ORF Transcript_63805/g.207339 Transcript_63805/m.207339 type:complete len:466 (-) Transcript_63805:24-1421(-)
MVVNVPWALPIASHHAPVPLGGVETWQRHPRLLRHMRLYRDSPERLTVLERYWKRIGNLNKRDLQRFACHAGSWIALLPLEVAAQPLGGDELSPARLLACLLRLRGSAPLTPWLRGVLHLVALRLKEAKVVGADRKAKHWAELRRSMPPTIWKNLVSRCPSLPRDGCAGFAASAKCASARSKAASKRLRLLDREVKCWCCYSPTEHEPHVERIKIMLGSIGGGTDDDAKLLREVVRAAAASLAPPRAKAMFNNGGQLMTDVDIQRLRAAAKLQRRVRHIFLNAIAMWRKLWSDDVQIEPMLSRVKLMIQHFESLGGDVRGACAGADWGIIQEAVSLHANSASLESVPIGSGWSPEGPGCAQKKNVLTPRASAKLKTAMLEAMHRLGGQGSSLQLIDMMRADPEIWASIEGSANRLESHSTVRMKNRKLECWEANVVNNSKRYCYDSGQKSEEGLRIWNLKHARVA